MTNKEFINILERLVNEPTVYYSVSGGDWCKWNGCSWNMDCVCMIKGILWGFDFNKYSSHGGANYGSNGVYDDTADNIINRCYNVSRDFSHIEPGELLHMAGHVGIYVGNGQVIEATAAWEGGVVKSQIGLYGERSKNGYRCLTWQEHGKLPYIKYEENVIPEINGNNDVNIEYCVKTLKHGWLPVVRNLEDYAGYENSPIIALAMKVDRGSIKYRVHTKKSGWLPFITEFDINNYEIGFAGDETEIDAVEVYYYTPDDIRPYKKAKYKVNDYPYQYDNETSNGQDGYAGEFGVTATKFQIVIE